MAYTITLTNGDTLTTIPDDSVDTTTSLSLVGRSYVGYGALMLENLIHMLENFASTNAPDLPLTGQLWFDATNLGVMVYTGSDWQPVWQASSGAAVLQSNGDTMYPNLPWRVPRYTVSALPVLSSAEHGATAFATNARNSGEGSSSGTGCLVYLSTTGTWLAAWSGLAPTI